MRSCIVAFVAFAAAGALTACTRSPEVARAETTAASIAAGAAMDTARPTDLRSRFAGIGRTATSADIRAWNIDVNGSGDGLPAGHGTYERGARVFAEKCSMCHGARGEGNSAAGYPRLIGPAASPDSFAFGNDVTLAHTIGNYWPYATTLYDYINRAMPFPAPGSLPPDDVYSVIAFLLAENGVIDRRTVIDARSLPRVRMPARAHFVVDDRTGGRTFR